MTTTLAPVPERHADTGEPLRAVVLVELAAYRDALRACRSARRRKGAALAQLVAAGVPKAWVGALARGWLLDAGWSAEDVEVVGMSDGMMRKVLDPIR